MSISLPNISDLAEELSTPSAPPQPISQQPSVAQAQITIQKQPRSACNTIIDGLLSLYNPNWFERGIINGKLKDLQNVSDQQIDSFLQWTVKVLKSSGYI